MTELEFKSLATQGYNRIPLIAEAFADLETPLTLYLKLAQTQNAGKNTFLLESVVGGERFGRYSFIGLPASTLMRPIRWPSSNSRKPISAGPRRGSVNWPKKPARAGSFPRWRADTTSMRWATRPPPTSAA